jgi:hypothetical protein
MITSYLGGTPKCYKVAIDLEEILAFLMWCCR